MARLSFYYRKFVNRRLDLIIFRIVILGSGDV